MKKKNIINLIRYHVDKNEVAFRNEAYEIARDFDKNGDTELAEYIMSLLSGSNMLVPQMEPTSTQFMEQIDTTVNLLVLPEAITKDILGISRAIINHMGIHTFLFKGKPGSGKTEAAKKLAYMLNRDLYMVNFTELIDSKLGQTAKNIVTLFEDIASFPQPNQVVVLMDEIDALAMDRTNSSDLREMERVTSTLLKAMDRLSENIVLVATTNLFEHLNKALIRRFDAVIDFDRYTREDLLDIAEQIFGSYLHGRTPLKSDIKLFRKIINLFPTIPYPGDLRNCIATAVAFSNLDDRSDYFRRLYYDVTGDEPIDLKALAAQKFTMREIEILTGVPKSTVARELKKAAILDIMSVAFTEMKVTAPRTIRYKAKRTRKSTKVSEAKVARTAESIKRLKTVKADE